MTFSPFVVDRFGGLDLASDPQEVGAGAALDLLNVDFRRAGRILTRMGTTSHVALASGTPRRVHPVDATYALVIRGGSLDKVTSGGAASNLGSTEWGPMVTLGTPTSTITFIAQDGLALLKKYDGTTYGNSVGRPVFIAVTPTDNRLVQARFTSAGVSPTGANGTESTVFFSDAGAPETFSANNYVHLRPGDGEVIRGMATWGGYVFVFKDTSMFVFPVPSVGSTGAPVFNYRREALPSRMASGRYAAVAGPDGLYFATMDGIYRTTGGPPVRMSQPVAPVFDGTASASLAATSTATFEMSWALERLFCTYATDGGFRVLVWDRLRDAWSAWAPGSGSWAPPVEWTGDSSGTDVALYTAKDGAVLKFAASATDDAGTAIESYYQSGFYDLGTPDRKRIREIGLWGYGAPTLSVFTDHGTTDTAAAAVTLGTSPAVAEGRQRVARRGAFFSHKLSAASGAWSVNRLTHYVADQRSPGVKPT